MAKESKKKTGRKLSARQLKQEVFQYLSKQLRKKFTPRQLAGLLKVENNKDSVEHALRQLEQEGLVTESKDGKFGTTGARPKEATAPLPTEEDALNPVEDALEAPISFYKEAAVQEEDYKVSKKKLRTITSAERRKEKDGEKPVKPRKTVEGRVDMTRTGAGYVVAENMDSDIFINTRYMNGALHGDRVLVSLFPLPPRNSRREQPQRKPEGEILKVIKRANEFFIGTLRLSRKYGLFLPDNPNMPVDIYIPLEAIKDGRDGDKVVVRVTDWQEGTRHVPIGKVTQVLGDMSGHDFEMKKILINAGFELSHSDEANAEANAIPDTISPQEIARRRDFRDILTFTIDPEDAKDFDDALSIRILENGHTEIGVHIADVTHYLKPDTPLDQEAYRRSTSVYLVDRCLPMLPEKLSNNLCSLVPHQDRLTFSAVFEFDAKDQIKQRWFGKTVIHSAKRFSYEEAQTVLDGQPSEELAASDLYPALSKALQDMLRIAQKMRKAREKEGAIGFETDEVRFILDENGSPISAYVKERKAAHLLIEDFMLLANKEVAFYIDQLAKGQQEVPFIYRVHDQPDMERVAEFARFAYEMGHPLKTDTPKQIAQSFNALMRAAQKDERLKLLEPLAIRTMAKAIYTSENIGHYGLGFSHYTHFTSPIRRYSDVVAHRILERNLDGRVFRMDSSKLEEQCKHISAQERKAAEAERESIKFKQVELISKHIGDEFEGTISGMVDRGMFVALDGSFAEGMVEFKYLDDLYVLEDGRLRAKGRHYGRVFRMGDRLKVRVIAADLGKRQIELEMVE